MISFLLPVAVGSGVGLATTYVLACQTRKEAHGHIERLQYMKRMAKDRESIEHEIAIQKAWLARPFWRQVMYGPCPDYANAGLFKK
jgi:hypothetical protein